MVMGERAVFDLRPTHGHPVIMTVFIVGADALNRPGVLIAMRMTLLVEGHVSQIQLPCSDCTGFKAIL